MERTKLLTVAVIGLLVLNLLTITFLILRPNGPRGPAEHGPPGGEGPARIIIERLHFDSPQQQRYQTLVKAHQNQTRLLVVQSVELYRAYYGLLESDQPDAVQARSLSEQLAQNQRAQAQLNFAHFAAIKALCHPDQQAYFKQLVSDLSRLFGRQPRPLRPNFNGPPAPEMEGPPGNLPSHP